MKVSVSHDGLHFIRLACGASIHTGMVLRALEEGAKGVLLLTCPEGHCHFREGSRWAATVAAKTQRLLELIGLPKNRVGHVEGRRGEDGFARMVSFAESLGVRVKGPESPSESEPERVNP
jgi:coenzyme F420-reducing hydrogenase delta subunit